jgi:hypothetical protein
LIELDFIAGITPGSVKEHLYRAQITKESVVKYIIPMMRLPMKLKVLGILCIIPLN